MIIIVWSLERFKRFSLVSFIYPNNIIIIVRKELFKQFKIVLEYALYFFHITNNYRKKGSDFKKIEFWSLS